MSDLMKNQTDPWELLLELVKAQKHTLEKITEYDFHFAMQDCENLRIGERLQTLENSVIAMEAVIQELSKRAS